MHTHILTHTHTQINNDFLKKLSKEEGGRGKEELNTEWALFSGQEPKAKESVR